jgi:hypothetical protein
MLKRNLLGLVSAATLAAAAAPALAAPGLGFDPYYVENPYAREVPQTHRAPATAFGFDPWYVPGRVDRAPTATASRDGVRPESTRPENVNRERYRLEQGRAYSVPAFGPQANA